MASFGFVSDGITALATVGLVITGVVAIVFAYVQLENERKYRRIENLEAQIVRFDSKAIVRQRKALAKARVDTDLKKLSKLDLDNAPNSAYETLNYFEHLGLLVRKGHLDAFDVWHSFDCSAMPIYYDLRPLIESERHSDNSAYYDFVKLVEKLQRIEMKECGAVPDWNQNELLNFYLGEMEGLGKAGAPRGKSRSKKRTPPRGYSQSDADGNIESSPTEAVNNKVQDAPTKDA